MGQTVLNINTHGPAGFPNPRLSLALSGQDPAAAHIELNKVLKAAQSHATVDGKFFITITGHAPGHVSNAPPLDEVIRTSLAGWDAIMHMISTEDTKNRHLLMASAKANHPDW